MSLQVSQHSLEEAEKLAAQVLEWLQGHGIPPSPLNYAVVYEYFGGGSPDLSAALDKLIAAEEKLDGFVLRDLYDLHIATDQYKDLRGVGNDLQGLLSNLIHHINAADAGMSGYGQTLTRTLGALHGEEKSETLRAIATDLLAATVDIQGQNQGLQRNLEETRQETEGLRQELEQRRYEALVDPLTGLYNRRAMDAQLDDWLAHADRPLAVVMLDIDHFKRINDTYGHAVGDIVIRNVAETMRKCIRGDDFAVRYGGEEFVVLLPDTDLKGAIKVAESIRRRIEMLRLVRRQDKFTLAPVTVSAGVAERHSEDTRESLFQRADLALYESKSHGRNRVSHEGILH